MKSSFVSVLVLIVGGIIVADILIHPTGVTAAGNQVNSFWGSSVSGLLGKAPATNVKKVIG